MAEIVENSKGFKVIKMSNIDVARVFGGMGICDYCNTGPREGYYIAVLNSCYCEKCYKSFMDYAHNYPEDRGIENKNFEIVINQLKTFQDEQNTIQPN